LTRIVDLSIAIHDNHCRWQMERVLRKSYERGDQFQATAATMSFHGFTTSDITPDMTIGPACVIDLPDTAPNTPITVADLEKANADLRAGDIALLRSNWEQQRSVEALSFWTDAPWLEADACRWLRAQRIKAIAYDFPQDYCIRDYATGERTPAWEENTSHIELLLHGIIMFEYLCNLAAIRSRRPLFIGLPIKVKDSDGAPARVVVIDEEQP
jgi:arylformamidase